MKRVKILALLIIFLLLFSVTSITLATDETTKLLYQDITINEDGSITVKECAWLQGDYNGRFRDIDFANYSATKFTGIYSNFTGNTDIYDGSSITDIKVYDISQSNFNSITDINKVENTYKQANNAKKRKLWCIYC